MSFVVAEICSGQKQIGARKRTPIETNNLIAQSGVGRSTTISFQKYFLSIDDTDAALCGDG